MNDSIMNQSTMNLSNSTVTKVAIKNHSMTLIILLAIFILEWIDISERFDPSQEQLSLNKNIIISRVTLDNSSKT